MLALTGGHKAFLKANVTSVRIICYSRSQLKSMFRSQPFMSQFAVCCVCVCACASNTGAVLISIVAIRSLDNACMGLHRKFACFVVSFFLTFHCLDFTLHAYAKPKAITPQSTFTQTYLTHTCMHAHTITQNIPKRKKSDFIFYFLLVMRYAV